MLETEKKKKADEDQDQDIEGDAPKVETKRSSGNRKLNTDGTYATESALTSAHQQQGPYKYHDHPILRALILNGEFQAMASLAACVTKLTLQGEAQGWSLADKNRIKAQALIILTSTIRVSYSPELMTKQLDNDSLDRILMYQRILVKPHPSLAHTLTKGSLEALHQHLEQLHNKSIENNEDKNGAMVDDEISFRVPSSRHFKSQLSVYDYSHDIERALGSQEKALKTQQLVSSLSKVVQLTGFSDEIYAETYVNINGTDIILDIMLINQVAETLQNVTFELCVSGELKLTEKPASVTLGPHGYAFVKASIKVRATAHSVIYGGITYGSGSDIQTIVISSINIDISEFIGAVNTVTDNDFRKTWPLLEWENKINIPATEFPGGLAGLMETLLQRAKLYCITPGLGINDSGDYLAANMYAQSVFSEEILANICLERTAAGISGHLRLRSKTQGIAVALGDRITDIVNLR